MILCQVCQLLQAFYCRIFYHPSPLKQIVKKYPGSVQKHFCPSPKSTFVLPPEARQSFQMLKEAFTKTPLLLHFDPQKPIRLETDASAVAIAGILLQPETYPATYEEKLRRQDQWHPVVSWSGKLNSAKINYNTP